MAHPNQPEQYGYHFYLGESSYILQDGKYDTSICSLGQRITTSYGYGSVHGTAIASNVKEALVIARKMIEDEYAAEVRFLTKLGWYDFITTKDPEKRTLDPVLALFISFLKGRGRKYLPMNNPDYPIEIV